MRKSVPAMLGVLLLSSASAAQAAYFRPYIEGGGEFGGDTFGTVFFAGGSSQDIKTGNGVWIGGGLNFRPSEEGRFGLRTGVGYKYVTTQATNVDIHISRVVLEAMPYFRFSEGFWGSAGVVKHAGVKFDGGGLTPDEDLDSSVGARFELGWRWIGVSYNKLEYTDRLNNKYDAGGFGVFLTSAFGGPCCRKTAPAPYAPAAYVPPAPPPATAAPAEPMPPAPAEPVQPAVQPQAVPPAVAAAPAVYTRPQGTAAFSRPGAILRTGPTMKGRLIAELPAHTAVINQSKLQTAGETWWLVDAAGFGAGWIPESELSGN